MKSELINEKLFEQFEAEGKEVVYTRRNGKKIRARIVDPIKTLFEKGYISFEESTAADKYSMDVELSLCANYAQAVNSGIPAGTSEFSFEDRRSQASIRVNHIKEQIKYLTPRRQRKLKNALSKINNFANLTSTTYEMILYLIFENRYSFKRVERAMSIHHDTISNKCKDIAKVIFNYYEN